MIKNIPIFAQCKIGQVYANFSSVTNFSILINWRKYFWIVEVVQCRLYVFNKDENGHRFALNAIRGVLFERERNSFGILYTGYLLSIVKIKRERERERKSERERDCS